jgi:hypothetical protein
MTMTTFTSVGWGIAPKSTSAYTRLQFFTNGAEWKVINEDTLESVDPNTPLEMASICGLRPIAITARKYINKQVSPLSLEDWLADVRLRKGALPCNQLPTLSSTGKPSKS